MSDEHRIHPQLILMHWLMAGLIIVAVAAILGRAQLPNGHEWRPVMRTVHLVTGQLILGLVLVRIFLRWMHAMPPAAGVNTWATWAGRAVHGLLYGVMLAQPLTGILFMQAGGKEVAFFGWHLPRLLEENKDLHFQLKEVHQTIGTAFYALLGMHVSAALFHHVVLRNATLHRMLPWLSVRQVRTPAPAEAGSTTTVVVDARPASPSAAPAPQHAPRERANLDA